jgi:hypothetical protein
MHKACLRLQDSTKKAVLVYPPEAPGKAFWIPRSVLTHRSALETDAAHLHPLNQFTVEGWWIEKHPEHAEYFS